jgi:hypothetical protein
MKKKLKNRTLATVAYIDNSLKSRLQLLLVGSRPRTERIENSSKVAMVKSLKKN